MVGFLDWLKLQEMGTGTNCIAVFARPVGGMISRNYPLLNDSDKKKPKKRKKKKKS